MSKTYELTPGDTITFSGWVKHTSLKGLSDVIGWKVRFSLLDRFSETPIVAEADADIDDFDPINGRVHIAYKTTATAAANGRVRVKLVDPGSDFIQGPAASNQQTFIRIHA
jgi:hypothetical protein